MSAVAIKQTDYTGYTQLNQSTETDDLPETNDSKIVQIMQQVVTAKEENVKASLSNKKVVYDPNLWGGDLFTMAYLGFQGVATSSSKLQALSGMILAGTILGVIGGVANILVAISTARELKNALKAKADMKLIIRLCFDCIFLTLIGITMILASLAQMVAIGGLGAFLIANPWLLPVLFFIITIPLIVELAARISPILTGKDMGSKLQLGNLKQHLNSKNWEKIEKLISTSHPFFINLNEPPKKHIIDKMENFQAEIGVKAALSAHKLMMHLKHKQAEESLKQIEDLEKEIADWNFSLYVRMGQQILYVLSFILSMVALPLKTAGAILNCADNWAMAGANAIPLYMDLFWPLKRNTPVVVPPVAESQLKKIQIA
jgi:hypothetical protein